jgi:hypothetical protein
VEDHRPTQRTTVVAVATVAFLAVVVAAATDMQEEVVVASIVVVAAEALVEVVTVHQMTSVLNAKSARRRDTQLIGAGTDLMKIMFQKNELLLLPRVPKVTSTGTQIWEQLIT